MRVTLWLAVHVHVGVLVGVLLLLLFLIIIVVVVLLLIQRIHDGHRSCMPSSLLVVRLLVPSVYHLLLLLHLLMVLPRPADAAASGTMITLQAPAALMPNSVFGWRSSYGPRVSCIAR